MINIDDQSGHESSGPIIKKRFRRSLQQELADRKKLGLPDFLVITAIAVAGSEIFAWPSSSYLISIVVWGAIAFGAYLLVALGFAQLRAKGQPLDHSLTISAEGITIFDHMRKQKDHYEWDAFKRVKISDDVFELTREGSEKGESYLFDRTKLSEEEDKFLGERFVEL